MSKTVRIGCGAGFWGDSAEGPKQLVASGQIAPQIDYLILDYLAEITMSLLARARAKDSAAGYASDFPEVLAALAPAIKRQGIKVVTNAGGVNPQACREAIAAKLKTAGIELRIGVVSGDDLLPRTAELKDVREMFTGTGFPDKPWSANAYLGAFPVAAALAAGADIVITGRCVDSALALGPLIHEFDWSAGDYDKLSAGSLAGHVIECGTQATGGITTDWKDTAADWDRMGFPIAECAADGSFVLAKPRNSGGRIAPETVAEQIVYEIGDPAAYLLPDVTCDWRHLKLSQEGPDRVRVAGARGYAPTASYKASVTFQDGFRATGTMMIGGRDAVARAQATADAILRRTRRLFGERGLADYLRSDVEVLGAEANWGANARARGTREVILKLSVHHKDKAALEIFSREFLPSATSMAQGITGFAGGRPAVTPLVRLFSCLVPKDAIKPQVEVDGVPLALPLTPGPSPGGRGEPEPSPSGRGQGEGLHQVSSATAETCTVPLIALAYGRSGDKGDAANVGVLARKPEFVPLLREQLTAEAVKHYLAHFVRGKAERFEIPGLHGFNFLLHEALGGGGMASLRYDPQGKMMAQILMDLPVRIPTAWVEQGLVRVPTEPA